MVTHRNFSRTIQFAAAMTAALLFGDVLSVRAQQPPAPPPPQAPQAAQAEPSSVVI